MLIDMSRLNDVNRMAVKNLKIRNILKAVL
jgi:hypothetical protein